MKTLGSLLIIIIGMFYLVPNIYRVEKSLYIPTDIIIPYNETPDIKSKKQQIEVIKTHISILISEAKLKLPYNSELEKNELPIQSYKP